MVTSPTPGTLVPAMDTPSQGYSALTELQVHALITRALDVTVSRVRIAGIDHHRARSAIWIEELARVLEEHYPQSSGATVFRSTAQSRVFRGRSEFLFDIAVCAVARLPAPVHAGEIDYVRAALLIVESEFANNLAESAEDFSKLVCGRAAVNLFVGPLSRKPSNYLGPLGHIAHYVGGALYCALVPHPSTWTAEQLAKPQLHQWVPEIGWRLVAGNPSNAPST